MCENKQREPSYKEEIAFIKGQKRTATKEAQVGLFEDIEMLMKELPVNQLGYPQNS